MTEWPLGERGRGVLQGHEQVDPSSNNVGIAVGMQLLEGFCMLGF